MPSAERPLLLKPDLQEPPHRPFITGAVMVDAARRPGIPGRHTKTPISATECPPLTRTEYGHGTTPADHARPTRGVCMVSSEEAKWFNRKVDVLDQLSKPFVPFLCFIRSVPLARD